MEALSAFLCNSFSYILVFRDPQDFSVNSPEHQSFSSLNPSYLLKVSEFLVKISKFKFLFMSEKTFLLIKFFVIKYFRFQFIFYEKTATSANSQR